MNLLNNMKRNIGLLLVAGVLVLSLAAGLRGQAAAESSKPAMPATPPAGSSFNQRLAFRKKEYNPKLNAEQKEQIQSECAAAQSVLGDMNSSAGSLLDKYNNTYEKVDGIVLVNIGQLKIAGQSTFDFAQQEKTLSSKINDFSELSRNYQQALNDSITINCAADPVGFQALVDTVRGYYQAIIDQSNGIAKYANNQIRTSLEGFVGKVGQ